MTARLHNTFAVKTEVAELHELGTVPGIIELLEKPRRLPMLIVGGGSNILPLDNRIEACVVKPMMADFSVQQLDEHRFEVSAGAGFVWHTFVMQCLQQGYFGLENLSLIPGTVGAAPIQNIGAYGVELKDCFLSLEAIDLKANTLRVFNAEELAFGYRDSFFKRQGKSRFVITNVRFCLHGDLRGNVSYEGLARHLADAGVEKPTPIEIAQAVIAIRQSKLPDPALLGNAGSFFKNPVVDCSSVDRLMAKFGEVPQYPQHNGQIKLAAGWLIEKAGLKGMRRGAAGTHDRQALVIVNTGGATGREIFEVAREVRDTVYERFEISLEPEVRILDREAQDVAL